MVSGLLAAALSLLVGTAVYAGLSATTTGVGSVTTGTLDLTLTPDAGAGFSSFVAALAPGDTDNVFVDLHNTGTLASAAGMTLAVTGSPATGLTDGSVPGESLTVTLTKCISAWKVETGRCRGRQTTILATTAVSGMSGGVALSHVRALAASKGKVAHLRVSLGLVATETSTNGTLPSGTVQGLHTTLTYAFTEQQRAAVAIHR